MNNKSPCLATINRSWEHLHIPRKGFLLGIILLSASTMLAETYLHPLFPIKIFNFHTNTYWQGVFIFILWLRYFQARPYPIGGEETPFEQETWRSSERLKQRRLRYPIQTFLREEAQAFIDYLDIRHAIQRYLINRTTNQIITKVAETKNTEKASIESIKAFFSNMNAEYHTRIAKIAAMDTFLYGDERPFLRGIFRFALLGPTLALIITYREYIPEVTICFEQAQILTILISLSVLSILILWYKLQEPYSIYQEIAPKYKDPYILDLIRRTEDALQVLSYGLEKNIYQRTNKSPKVADTQTQIQEAQKQLHKVIRELPKTTTKIQQEVEVLDKKLKQVQRTLITYKRIKPADTAKSSKIPAHTLIIKYLEYRTECLTRHLLRNQ